MLSVRCVPSRRRHFRLFKSSYDLGERSRDGPDFAGAHPGYARLVPLAPEWVRPPQTGKIRHVVVPCASNRPLASVTRPSAVPIRRPQLRTVPSALIWPVSGVMARTSEILN